MIPDEFRPSVRHEFYIIRTILYRIVTDFAMSRGTGDVLDFGCGSGPYRSLFDGANYTAVDFPTTGHRDSDKQVDIYWDGKKLPFSNDSFDTVLMTEVLEHLFEPEVVLSELRRVLRPGGKLLITTPFIWELHEVPYDYARYTLYGIQSLALHAGYSVVHGRKHGSNLDVIIQILVCSRLLAGKRSMGRLQRIITVLLNSLSDVRRHSVTVNSTTDRFGFYVTNEFVLSK